MKFEIIDDKTIKILLSPQDMQGFGLTYDQMDYNDDLTRSAVLEIVRRIRQDTSLPLDDGKLLIEAFPEHSGGCILYMNLTEEVPPMSGKTERRSFDTPLIFRFCSIDSVAGVSRRLLTEYSHLIFHSSLYLTGQSYCMLLYIYCRMEKTILAVLNEYGTFLGKGPVLSAFVQEHGRPVLNENAIEIIAKYIG